MALVRRLLGAAVLLAAVAVAPQGASVAATETDSDSSTGVLCGGTLNLEIVGVDGRTMTPAKRVDLAYGPTPSTFALSHRITLRNDGTVPLRGLALTTLRGPRDNAALARLLRVRVQVGTDGSGSSTDTGDLRLSDLEKSASRPVPLPAVIGRYRTARIQLTFSAIGLDNAVAGASVSPTMVFVGSG